MASLSVEIKLMRIPDFMGWLDEGPAYFRRMQEQEERDRLTWQSARRHGMPGKENGPDEEDGWRRLLIGHFQRDEPGRDECHEECSQDHADRRDVEGLLIKDIREGREPVVHGSRKVHFVCSRFVLHLSLVVPWVVPWSFLGLSLVVPWSFLGRSLVVRTWKKKVENRFISSFFQCLVFLTK